MLGRDKDRDQPELDARDVMSDAVSITDWMRERDQLDFAHRRDLEAMKLRLLEDTPTDESEHAKDLRWARAYAEFNREHQTRTERLQWLVTTIDAAMARARLVEVAALAERWANL